MRLLHTSDWHLGARSGPVSRAEDHELFLAWLLDRLRTEPIDALVVAGDVFDHPQPSAEAQRQYYRFLDAAGRTGVRDVVVVGGNHDSPSRLDAPAEVLASLDVHVVGGLPTVDSLDRCLVPLRRRGTDEVAAVCVAIPYVHEHRLGVRTTDADGVAVRAAFREAFSALYAGRVDAASARWPEVPILATGHLTVGHEATPDDAPQAIHQAGRIEALSADLLDPRLVYTALGHIHRSGQVAARAWYSGSPIAMSVRESASPRRVLEVDLAANARVTPVDLPHLRELIALSGSRADVLSRLGALRSEATLPPLVQLRVLDDPDPLTLRGELEAVLASHPEARRPVVVGWESSRTAPVGPRPPPVDLARLGPSGVLAWLARDLPDADRLVAALDELASLDEATFEARLAELEGL